MGLKNFSLTFLIAGAICSVVGQQVRKATLYEQFENSGMSIQITENVEDLSTEFFDNRTRSACVVGMWNFYTEPKYGYGHAFWGFSANTNGFCFDLPDDVAGAVSSAKFAGSPLGLSYDTFTLYEYETFMGAEEYITRDRASLLLAGNHSSIIVTGRSNWTVFEGDNFSGPRMCLVSAGDNPVPISNTSQVGIRPGSLKSVKKGCEVNPSVMVDLKPFMIIGETATFN